VLFPPSVAASGAVGAGAGVLVSHFRKSLSDSDVRDLAELVEPGEAGLLVVAQSRVASVLGQNLVRARATIERGIERRHDLVQALVRH
jgi:uncharacterized membrane protein